MVAGVTAVGLSGSWRYRLGGCGRDIAHIAYRALGGCGRDIARGAMLISRGADLEFFIKFDWKFFKVLVGNKAKSCSYFNKMMIRFQKAVTSSACIYLVGRKECDTWIHSKFCSGWVCIGFKF